MANQVDQADQIRVSDQGRLGMSMDSRIRVTLTDGRVCCSGHRNSCICVGCTQRHKIAKNTYFGLFWTNFDSYALRKTLCCQNLEKLCLQKDSQIFSAFYGIMPRRGWLISNSSYVENKDLYVNAYSRL